jgi:nucleosome assembly protein 1-like 1
VFLGLDIKNKNPAAPTPQNTPINPAPITSTYRPSIPAISEDSESKY